MKQRSRRSKTECSGCRIVTGVHERRVRRERERERERKASSGERKRESEKEASSFPLGCG
jgi:hypothetical protein